MKRLYKASMVMGLSTIVMMALGAVRSKFMALQLGPSGVGIFSQAMTFFQAGETLCGLGIGLGVTKYVAEMWRARDMDGLKKTVASSVKLQFLSFIVFFLFVSVFSKNISQFVFSTTEYSPFLVLVSGAVLFSVLIGTLESAILGLSRPGIFSKSRIIYNLAGVILLVVFVGAMKLAGSFIYVMVNAMVSLAIVYFYLSGVLKSEGGIHSAGILKEAGRMNFGSHSPKLLSYGAVMLISSSIGWISILYVRSLLIRHEGAAANGLYQVVLTLTGYYSQFFTNGIWGHLFPSLSAMKEMSDFNAEINKTLRFIFLFLTPSLAALFLLKRAVVIAIFSGEFVGSLAIFPLYLLGNFFFILTYISVTVYLANRQLKTYFLVNLAQNLFYAALFAALVGRLGLAAVPVSYCLANIVSAALSMGYQAWRGNVRVSRQNIGLLIASIVFIVTILFVPVEGPAAYLFKWLLVALWALFVIGKDEIAALFSFMRPA